MEFFTNEIEKRPGKIFRPKVRYCLQVFALKENTPSGSRELFGLYSNIDGRMDCRYKTPTVMPLKASKQLVGSDRNEIPQSQCASLGAVFTPSVCQRQDGRQYAPSETIRSIVLYAFIFCDSIDV